MRFSGIFSSIFVLLLACSVHLTDALEPIATTPSARVFVVGNTVNLLLKYIGPRSFWIPGPEDPFAAPTTQALINLGRRVATQWSLSLDGFVSEVLPDRMSDWLIAAGSMQVSSGLYHILDPRAMEFNVQVEFDVTAISAKSLQIILLRFLQARDIPLVQGVGRRSAINVTELIEASINATDLSEIRRRAPPTCPAQAPYDDKQFWKYVSGPPEVPKEPTTQTACSVAHPQPSRPGQPSRICYGVARKRWVGRDALNANIGDFCKIAGQQGVHDKDSGSIMRPYNVGGDYVALNIDWPSGSTWKADALSCFNYMRDIMDGCDGNDPNGNPYNWKAGGEIRIGEVKYRITPLTDRYRPGYCRTHVLEKATWDGNDVRNSQRHWTFRLIVSIFDQANDRVGGNYDAEAGKDGANGLVAGGLYQPLTITPQGAGDMPLQFKIGENAWANTDNSKFNLNGSGNPSKWPGQHCEETPWDKTFHVYKGESARSVTCWFPC